MPNPTTLWQTISGYISEDCPPDTRAEFEAWVAGQEWRKPDEQEPPKTGDFLALIRKRDGKTINTVGYWDSAWSAFLTRPGNWRIEQMLLWRPLGPGPESTDE